MNIINPGKLIQSKWTAVSPQGKERHFIVTKITDLPGKICQIEAIINKKTYQINWVELEDCNQWQTGWR